MVKILFNTAEFNLVTTVAKIKKKVSENKLISNYCVFYTLSGNSLFFC